MIFGALLLSWLLITFFPLRTNPEFVVREIKGCCHHQIRLKCEYQQAKLAIIQARYILSTKVKIESRERVKSEGPSQFTTLWDMDVEFDHDLMHQGKKNSLSDLNSPDWMKLFSIRRNATRRRLLSYTTPNPIPNGSHLMNHTIELPLYEKSFLDRDTIWKQTLLRKENNEKGPRNNSGSESEFINEIPCLSYEHISRQESKFKRKFKMPNWDYMDLRPVFNHRCSGRSECVVDLLRNKLKDQDLTRVCYHWPEGRIVVKFVCLDTTSGDVHSNCNEDVTPAQEGFILNPGYPDLYPGDRPCQWRLKVEEQRLLLVFLDISLRGKEKSRCRDELMVSEDRSKLLSVCGDQASSIAVLSPSYRLNVTFNPESRLAFPKRGFLLYFRVIGCENPGREHNSYLVSRNASHAYFHCEVGYFLPQTLKQTRWLTCNPVNRTWSSTQPKCTDIHTLFGDGNGTWIHPSIWPVINRTALGSIVRDYILPSVILSFVLICNTCFLLWIKKRIKRREKLEKEDEDGEEEMEMISTSSTPAGIEGSTFTLSSDGMEPGGKPWYFLESTDLEEKVSFFGEHESKIDNKAEVRIPKSNGRIYHNGNGILPMRDTSFPQCHYNGNMSPYGFPKTTQV